MTLANLANVYSQRKEWAKARVVNERIVATFERDLGPEHANTAMMYANLAKVLGALHDPDVRPPAGRHRLHRGLRARQPVARRDADRDAGWLVAQGEVDAALD